MPAHRSYDVDMRMITLVDDDEGVREATANLLRSLGYEVRTFESGRALLDWTGLNETSCVITDIMMPEIDGFELHRRLASGGYRFPIIFLTALTDAVAEARMRECQVHCILTKPCSERHLLDCVRSALGSGPADPCAGPTIS
jgi:FixJ family two-component response regulator